MNLRSDGFFTDKNSYIEIWNKLISPVIDDYSEHFADICVAHNASDVIWERYVYFNKHCKEMYMEDSTGKLDRHKVCACYMYAIVSAGVMSCKLADSDTEESYLALNENLAITVGMSLLRGFILSSIESSEQFTSVQKNELISMINDGIIFPDCNHGDYRKNFVAELHYTQLENRYNILSLANTLFLLETHTLKIDAIHKQ